MFDIFSFISGGIAGIIQTLVGHPFDTMKTLIQNNKPINKSFYISPVNWYSGYRYPLITGIFSNSMIFGIESNIKNLIDIETSMLNININPIYKNAISGGLTGTILTFFILPFENWKIQTQLDVCKDMISKKGFTRSMYHGFNITLLRESIAMSVYFSSYNYFRRNDYQPFTSGLLAGIFNWSFTYPIDTIKSRIQSYKYDTIIDAYKARNLWKGFPMVLLRAGLVNGSIFYVYETIKKTFK
jgi:solute carrier family 25 carnitine/acylcarnitine transporter 20/29